MDKNSLESLMKKLPRFSESRMVGSGYAVWAVWRMNPDAAVTQTLADYGGLRMATERRQELWFFFNQDAVLALAKLEVWARLNPMKAFIEVMPAKLLVDHKLTLSLSLETGLDKQEVGVPEEFQVLAHPKSAEENRSLPGVSMKRVEKRQGLAKVEWRVLQADPRLPYPPSLGWYMVLKPLGAALDKAFQQGWREFFGHTEVIIKKLKNQYILHDSFLMLPLNTLRELRFWCREYLQLVRRLKEPNAEGYWPCVLAVVEKRGLNLSNDLYRKIPLDWDQLAPDFPHMTYRSAFLLGEGFKIKDVRFSVEQSSLDNWCNVQLADGAADQEESLNVELPARLVAGKHGNCFYCGLRSHPMERCPSRRLDVLEPEAWERIAVIDFNTMNEGLRGVDAKLSGDGVEGLTELLHQSEGVESSLVKAIYETNAPCQLRMLKTIWRSMGRDYPRGLSQLAPGVDDALDEALETLRDGELVHAERLTGKEIFKSPRDYKPLALRGFIQMERGDPLRAISAWAEAERNAATPLQQAYLVFLQARAMEVTNKLEQATELYKKAHKITPQWLDAAYRQAVCQVKMGFAEQAMGYFESLMERNPHMFNRALFDPELERGHVQILTALYRLWVEAKARAEEETKSLAELQTETGKWFTGDHPFADEMAKRISALQRLAEVKNYVAFIRLVQDRMLLSKDFHQQIEEESRELRKKFSRSMERLKQIQRESAWFPFPRILVDFNKDFNYCARQLNWALSQHLQVAENFRRASDIEEKLDVKLDKLEGRLKTLRIIRDSTLFLMIFVKTFLWVGGASLLISFVTFYVLLLFGPDLGLSFTMGLTTLQKFKLQISMMVGFLTLAFALSGLRTALIFEGRKEKLLGKLEAKAEKAREEARAQARQRKERAQLGEGKKGAPKALPPGR